MRQSYPATIPPEILPRDLGDPWSLNNAARGALGLLLAGEKPGPRLYAVADYLLTLRDARCCCAEDTR